MMDIIFQNIMVDCNVSQQSSHWSGEGRTSMNGSKRMLSLLLILVLAIVPLLSRGSVESESKRISLQAVDANGRTVTLDAEPRRVIVAGKSALMPADAFFMFPEADAMILAMSKTDQGLGDFYNLISPKIRDSKRLAQNASAEEIARYAPDLVLLKSSNFEGTANKLDQLGIVNFTMELESAEAWNSELLQLGKLLGKEERAQELVELYVKRNQMVRERIETLDHEKLPTVLVLQFSVVDGTTAFEVCPDSWIQTQMVETAGGVPVWTDSGLASNAWSKVSFEQIAAWNPDFIYIVSYKTPADKFLEAIYSDFTWKSLRSTQSRQIKAMPSDLVSFAQPDSRWILALQWMAANLHPALFPGFDMQSEVASFYRDFYHLEDHLIEELARSLQGGVNAPAMTLQ